MGFISRLLGRQKDGPALSSRVHPVKRQQPSSPASGSFAPDCFSPSRPVPAAVILQNLQPVVDQADESDDDGDIILVPSVSHEHSRHSSLGKRRSAIDISPAAAQRLADRVALLQHSQLRASLDGSEGGVTSADIEELYEDMQLVHRGRSSLVYRAREVRSGRRMVLKAYDAARLTPSKRANLERHVRCMRAAMCVLGPQGGAVLLERVVESPTGSYLVLQACNGGTLIEAIANAGGKLPERQVALKVALPVLTTLAHMHAAGICHRNIKPEHLMINDGHLTIGDFGNAACTTAAAANLRSGSFRQQKQSSPTILACGSIGKPTDQPHTVAVTASACSGISVSPQPAAPALAPAAAFCNGGSPAQRDAMNFRTGSIEYMAPEMLDKPTSAEVFHLVIAQGIDEDDLPSYDEKVDVWSVGVVLYEALTGLQPFLADNAADMAAVIRTKLYEDSQREKQLPAFIERLPISADGKSFIAACLTWDVQKRPSAAELLRHPWLASMQQQAVLAASCRSSRRCSVAAPSKLTSAAAAAVAIVNDDHEPVHEDQAPHALSGLLAPASCKDWFGSQLSKPPLHAPAAAAAPFGSARSSSARRSSGRSSGARSHAASDLLVDELLAATLRALPEASLTGRVECGEGARGLQGEDGSRASFSRSHTTANLDVGMRSMLRTSTQRLQQSHGASGMPAA